MRQRFHLNPDWTAPWNAADLKEYLREARAYYEAKRNPPAIARNHGLPWDSPYRIHAKERPSPLSILGWLYKLGRDLRVLPLNFEQFKREVQSNPDPYGWTRRKWRKRYAPRERKGYVLCGPHQEPYRQRNQHAHVPKKELSEKEIARRDWREHKQFKRDKCKGKGWFRGCGRKTWAKRYSNRMERRHVHECLHHGREDEIESHRLFQDKWMWD